MTGETRATGTCDGTDAGLRLFARYAHAPNARGYCGPDVGGAYQRVACGSTDPADAARARQAARQFSGAWPYQCLVAELSGLDDPLSERVGRAYWTGNDLTDMIDRVRFARALLDRFAGQAGHYWTHLEESLLPEVTATHAFHVFGVYPWSRLLGTGLPEPLMVLDSCRIRAGRVLDADDRSVRVELDGLAMAGSGLRLTEATTQTIDYRTGDGTFLPAEALATLDSSAPGAEVAVHWGFACDVLTPAEAAALRRHTTYQLRLTNARLARAGRA